MTGGMTDAIAELLMRHELGDFDARVRARLDDIFTTDPPDAIPRLQAACGYLGITEATPETDVRVLALLKSRNAASQKSDTPQTQTAERRPNP